MIIFFHGWQGIGSPKLLKRLEIDPAALGGAKASSHGSPIAQKFSWGPETYALIFLVGVTFLSVKTTPSDLWNHIVFVVLVAAGSFLLLCYRIFERINRCTLALRRDSSSGGRSVLEMSSRFGKKQYFDTGKLRFEAPHPGYIVLAIFWWGFAVFVLVQVAFNLHSGWDLLVCGLIAMLCAAMAVNVFRTKIVLFRCYFSESEAKYISKGDARRIALAAIGH